MNAVTLIATTSFGLETVLGFDLKRLGIENITKENGRVIFDTDVSEIPRLNINLRTAERVFIRLSSFKCFDFDDLFENLQKIDWGSLIPEDGNTIVNVKSVKSEIKSISSTQSVSKKAIIELLKKKYKIDWLPENGPEFRIIISLHKNQAEVLLDTSGHGLNRRGYRAHHGDAPLRETLAASIIDLSRWRSDEVMIDPLCGTGTILIEAALKARNIAPGLKSHFDSENWPIIPQKYWDNARNEARSQITDLRPKLYGYDNDKNIISVAKKNASKAGVGEDIVFTVRDIKDFDESFEKAFIITNPPYGERLSENVEALYKTMALRFLKLENWRIFILTGFENFTKIFGKRSSKNRKLYNGKIRCYLHSYFQ